MIKTAIGEGGEPGDIHGGHSSRTFMNGFQWRLYDSVRQMKCVVHRQHRETDQHDKSYTADCASPEL